MKNGIKIWPVQGPWLDRSGQKDAERKGEGKEFTSNSANPDIISGPRPGFTPEEEAKEQNSPWSHPD